MKSLVIPDIGTFEYKQHEGYACPKAFFDGLTIDVRVYPKGEGEPNDRWKAARANEFSLFSEHFEVQLKRLPDMIRKICREYDMYEGIEIPWTDEELIDGFEWNDIKLNGDGTVECCVDPTQSEINNFSVLFGFDKDMTLKYAHFDG